MTEKEWIEKAREHADDLAYLVSAYHPAALGSTVESARRPPLPITAPGPEVACEVVREKIRGEYEGEHPIRKFRRAVEAGDVSTVMSLLSGAWFGVPESTSCWGIRGFSKAVDLLEDPPEPEDDEVECPGPIAAGGGL